ncbi:MAG: Cro/CI family transcriptional regulator [Candidatus Paceibacterota bacterium]|jgi:hypothetical protein
MLSSTVFAYFSSKTEVWRLLGLTSGAVSQWGEVVPEKQAMRLERLTKKKLKYDPSLYQKV